MGVLFRNKVLIPAPKCFPSDAQAVELAQISGFRASNIRLTRATIATRTGAIRTNLLRENVDWTGGPVYDLFRNVYFLPRRIAQNQKTFEENQESEEVFIFFGAHFITINELRFIIGDLEKLKNSDLLAIG